MNLVDIFCGCGGFSIGAHNAGFDVVSAFDIDKDLTSSFNINFPKTKLLLRDVASLTGDDVRASSEHTIDGIFGGPPCQGFSEIGKRDASDPRRELLTHFFRLVDEVSPKFFVMENVAGIVFADARPVLDAAITMVEKEYAILGPFVINAADFGAATSRKRVFVIGIRKDIGVSLCLEDILGYGVLRRRLKMR